MNIFKFSLSSLLVFLSLFFYTTTNAVTVTEAKPNIKPSQGVLVASVNIQNAKIVSQDGNNIKISFDIKNGEGLQAGVKYGVKLFTDDKNQSLVDEKVYDESLTLSENSSITREVTYEAPNFLNGNFTILLQAKNESNFPFGSYIVGKIKLVATDKWLEILPESCFLQIPEAKDSKRFTLMQNVELDPSQSLVLNCSAVNKTDSIISATPSFETRYSGSFGEIANQSGGSTEVINFSKNEKKNLAIILPKGDVAKLYSVKFSLTDGIKSSNTISLGYSIKGANATIQKVSLDKDYYKAGEKAELSLIWFGGSFKDNSLKVTVQTSITNKNNRLCASEDTQVVTKDVDPISKIYIPIKNTCENPNVVISISDSDGNVLDQKEFGFKTSKIDNIYSTKDTNNKQIYIIIALLLLVVAISILVNRKRKINNIKMQ